MALLEFSSNEEFDNLLKPGLKLANAEDAKKVVKLYCERKCQRMSIDMHDHKKIQFKCHFGQRKCKGKSVGLRKTGSKNTDCEARMRFSKTKNILTLKTFIEEHNHDVFYRLEQLIKT